MDFAGLQKQIRSDPEGYRSEFLLQLRHYEAMLQIFNSRPEEPSKEFVNLVRFVAAVADAYPKETVHFATELMQLLEKNYEILDKAVRKAFVQSLMQLRRQRRIDLMQLLPLFFRLFSCKDKPLRHMIFSFIVADIKASENAQGQRLLNRQMKGFLLNTLRDDNEMIAKKALAILTDLWRRQIWHDVHTANVIASAVQHPKNSVMYAAVKFFLGYDLKECEEEDDEADEEKIRREAQISTEDIYKAQKKGTRSSKKKKMKKLKRIKSALIRQARKDNVQLTEQFAAIQLLQDPYKIAEILFSRARSGRVTTQTRLAIIQLLSRIISVHQLVMLNFYPYLQKYLFPNGRDILTILAALAEGCHEMVPPDALTPALRQLVDSFVHDHARPEVITIGLKTVREMCSRAPLIMSEELLSDLILYRRFKDAEVKAAAKGLVSLFRDIAPQMLPKKDRGRAGQISDQQPLSFGQKPICERVAGAELLEKEKRLGLASAGDDAPTEVSESEAETELESGEDGEVSSDQVTATDGRKPDPSSLTSLKKQFALLKEKKLKEKAGEEEILDIQDSDSESMETSDDEEPADSSSSANAFTERSPTQAPLVQPEDGSEMKRLNDKPIEMTEILNDQDFERLKELKRNEAIEQQLRKYGLLPGHERSVKLMEAAENDADEMLKRKEKTTHLTESGLEPTELLGKKRGKANKTERMLSVLRGRESTNPYSSKTANKKRKTGGLSNKEKIKRKDLPLKGRLAQARKRRKVNALKRKGKNFKGHVKKH